jgi:hypothetical protein
MILRLSSAKVMHLAVVPILVFWIAGTGCLLGCGNHWQAAAIAATERAPHSLTKIASGDTCASRKSHACCLKKHGRSEQERKKPTEADIAALLPQSSGMMKDCPLAVNAHALSTKARTNEESILAADHEAPPRARETQDQLASIFPPAVLLNRGHSYLRCCVFLI